MKCETNKSPLALLGNLRNPARTQIQNSKCETNMHESEFAWKSCSTVCT